MGFVCEAPSCLASSARVQTCSCVNLGEQNRILGCTGSPPKICFQTSGFGHCATKVSSFFPNYTNPNLLLIFPTIWKQTFFYLIIFGNINFVIFLCIMLVQIAWKGSLDTFIKWMVKNVEDESSNDRRMIWGKTMSFEFK